MKKQNNTLRRALHPMPKALKELLIARSVWDAYRARPPYQRNDYLGWITRAKLELTKEKRTGQMLEELKQGDRNMKMKWKPR